MKKAINLSLGMAVAVLMTSCNIDNVLTETTPMDQYYRPKHNTSLADCNKVYEYVPAPGQFINDQKTGGFAGDEMLQKDANRYAEGRLRQRVWCFTPTPWQTLTTKHTTLLLLGWKNTATKKCQI